MGCRRTFRVPPLACISAVRFHLPQSKFRFRKYIVCGKACLESARFAGPKTPRTSAAIVSAAIVCDYRYTLATPNAPMHSIAARGASNRRTRKNPGQAPHPGRPSRRLRLALPRQPFRTPLVRLKSGSISAPMVQLSKRPHRPSGSLPAAGDSRQRQIPGHPLDLRHWLGNRGKLMPAHTAHGRPCPALSNTLC